MELLLVGTLTLAQDTGDSMINLLACRRIPAPLEKKIRLIC
jgi:hypothetical protein